MKAPVVTANVAENGSIVSGNATGNGANGEASSSAAVASSSAGKPPIYKERPTTPSTASSSTVPVEDSDPEGITIPVGAKCKRAGCKAVYQEGMSRSDDECRYHPLPAIFHEGSKGYACCKRRVLEFDEFLKIEGCKTGKHCFVGQPKEMKEGEEELVQCRHDMYQTPSQVGLLTAVYVAEESFLRVIIVSSRSSHLSSQNNLTSRNRPSPSRSGHCMSTYVFLARSGSRKRSNCLDPSIQKRAPTGY